MKGFSSLRHLARVMLIKSPSSSIISALQNVNCVDPDVDHMSKYVTFVLLRRIHPLSLRAMYLNVHAYTSIFLVRIPPDLPSLAVHFIALKCGQHKRCVFPLPIERPVKFRHCLT